MLRRVTMSFARLALTGLVGIGLAAAAFVWGLSAGPVRLAFLDRPIADALAALAPDLRAEVGRTELARAGRGVVLRVSDVRLASQDGAPILALPAIAVRPSLGALVRGRFVIARVDLADASVGLVRPADGEWRLGTAAGSTEGGGASPKLSDLFRGSTGGRPTQALPRITLTRTRLTVDDALTGTTLALGDGDLVVAAEAERVEVTGSAVLDVETKAGAGRGALHLPVRLALSTSRSAAAETTAGAGATSGPRAAIALTLEGDGGTLVPLGDAGTPFPLANLAIEAEYHPEVETLRFSRIAGRVGASSVAATATAILRDRPMLALDGTVDALAVTNLTRLWPAGLAASPRNWLATRIREGTLRRCRVQLAVHGAVPAADPAPVGTAPVGTVPAVTPPPAADARDAYDVACDFDGVAADYLPSLDPVRAAKGTARLTAERLQVDVKAGEVGACKLDGGTLTMDLTVEPPRATIAADVSGTGAAVLALVDRPPLGLVAPLGITPADLGGESRVHADLRFPVKGDLTGAEVGVKARAELTRASLPPLFAGVGLTNGALVVQIDDRTVAVDGTTTVTGLVGMGFVEATAPVKVQLTVAPASGAPAKRATEPAAQRITLTLAGERLAARGTAILAGKTVTAATVEQLRFDQTDIAGTLTRDAGGRYAATLTGSRFDLAGLLTRLRSQSGSALEDATAAGLSYTLAVRLGSVQGADALEIRDLRGTIQAAAGRVGAFTLAGALVPDGTIQATLAASSGGTGGARRLTVTTDQAGRVLQSLGGFDKMIGGNLSLDATTDARGPTELLDGKLVVRDFKIVRAPALAKVLGLGSLGGIAAMVQSEGLPMAKARTRFHWEKGRLDIRELRAVGAVGVTADGNFQPNAGTCDVWGNVIPAYTINSALGKVPLLGRFLVGGKGQGVFGIDYRVYGKTADPKVWVNPLTSVAPTVLRKWFIDPFTQKAD